jgi:hypothetical protein
MVAETKFAFRDAKMFPNKFKNIFVVETMFSSLPTCSQPNRHAQDYIHGRKMMVHHVSNILDQFTPNVPTAMLPSLPTLENMQNGRQQCFLVCPGLKSY